MTSHSKTQWRPKWWFWVVYVVSLLLIFQIAFVASALLAFWNPWLVGMIAMQGAGLRVTWWAAKKKDGRK